MADKLEGFLQALNTLSDTSFPTADYVEKLVAAGLKTNAGNYLSANLSSPVAANDAKFNGSDCTADVCNLMVASAARGIAQVSDDYGFHGCVDIVSFNLAEVQYLYLLHSRARRLPNQSLT
jgi:hypothetical protein